MGKVKDQAQAKTAPSQNDEALEVTLKDEEFNYIMNVNVARNNVNQEYNRVMSAFLHYISCSRMGFESTDNLKFELDFDDETHKLKIWKIEEDFSPKPDEAQDSQKTD